MILFFFQFFKHFSFPLPVRFLLLKSLKILLWEKYCNYPLTTKQCDRFASCENIVSRSQTSSLPPPPPTPTHFLPTLHPTMLVVVGQQGCVRLCGALLSLPLMQCVLVKTASGATGNESGVDTLLLFKQRLAFRIICRLKDTHLSLVQRKQSSCKWDVRSFVIFAIRRGLK